jgi:hypothetical protein
MVLIIAVKGYIVITILVKTHPLAVVGVAVVHKV